MTGPYYVPKPSFTVRTAELARGMLLRVFGAVSSSVRAVLRLLTVSAARSTALVFVGKLGRGSSMSGSSSARPGSASIAPQWSGHDCGGGKVGSAAARSW